METLLQYYRTLSICVRKISLLIAILMPFLPDIPTLVVLIHFHDTVKELKFLEAVKSGGKEDERSRNTHSIHKHRFSELTLGKPIDCLLLGTSTIERFQVTGQYTQFGTTSQRTRLGITARTFPGILNVGVGGEKVANVLFRLGVWDCTANSSDVHLQEICLVLEALVKASPAAKILVAGILPRKDININYVNSSNEMLRNLVSEFWNVYCSDGGEVDKISVRYLPPSPRLNDTHFIDDVDLNEAGYKIFADDLYSQLKACAWDIDAIGRGHSDLKVEKE
ncbi:hypothetical protein FQN57_004942 [Myotisia sp. PD_48]|nr:hypothetical protein FQN57_004942 [Myotisia sp. PD_48]